MDAVIDFLSFMRELKSLIEWIQSKKLDNNYINLD